jgi:NAD(P)-dependent dehydrogenase (short-subunit alcohol dehydrogenase family)
MEVKPFGIDVIVIEPGGIRSEWADIAISNMLKVSPGTAYKKLIDGAVRMTEKMKADKKAAAPPFIIADLVRKAITAAEPRARYSAGYMSGAVLFMKKWLSDKMMDKMIISQLK